MRRCAAASSDSRAALGWFPRRADTLAALSWVSAALKWASIALNHARRTRSAAIAEERYPLETPATRSIRFASHAARVWALIVSSGSTRSPPLFAVTNPTVSAMVVIRSRPS